MFRVFVRKRKRRISSPRTIALSVGAHLVLVGGFVAVSNAAPAPAPKVEEIVNEFPIETPKAPPEPVVKQPVAPPELRQPDAPPAPKPGETLQLQPPATIPDHLPAVDPHATPITPDQVTGRGPIGDVLGPPAAAPAAPTGNTEGTPGNPSFGDYVYGGDMVEEKPVLANGREVARMFDRNYPQALSEAGIAGQVTLEMIVEADGRVRPGSARVISTTHAAFSEATLRIVERFRFRPARMGDNPVAVMVTLPVDWKPQQ